MDGIFEGADRRKPSRNRIGILTICLLGVGRVIGARCKYWNEGLRVGQNNFMMFTVIECTGAILMASCLAEMAGSLPFTGGTFGFARGIYGPYLGFIVAVLEILTNVFGMSSLMLAFGQACAHTFALSNFYQPFFYLLLLSFTVSVQCLNISLFTKISNIMVGASFLLTMLYICGSIPQVRYEHFAFTDIPGDDKEGALAIIGYAALPTYFFTGLEMLPILAHYARNPRKAITYGLGSTVAFGVIAILSTCIVTVGQYPGRAIVRSSSLPLNYGFANLFNIALSTASVFNIPLLLTSFVIGQYFICIILRSMAKSHLLPSYFGTVYQWKGLKIPGNAMMLSYGLCIFLTVLCFVFLFNSFKLLINLSLFMGLCFYTLYICLFITYLSFISRFPSLPRYFVSPFGASGAYIGIAIYVFFGLSTCFFHYGPYFFAFLIIFLWALTYVYLRFIRRKQTFSHEEERVFFIAYVINATRIRYKDQLKESSSVSWWQNIVNGCCVRLLPAWMLVDEPVYPTHVTPSSPDSTSVNHRPNGPTAATTATTYIHRLPGITTDAQSGPSSSLKNSADDEDNTVHIFQDGQRYRPHQQNGASDENSNRCSKNGAIGDNGVTEVGLERGEQGDGSENREPYALHHDHSIVLTFEEALDSTHFLTQYRYLTGGLSSSPSLSIMARSQDVMESVPSTEQKWSLWDVLTTNLQVLRRWLPTPTMVYASIQWCHLNKSYVLPARDNDKPRQSPSAAVSRTTIPVVRRTRDGEVQSFEEVESQYGDRDEDEEEELSWVD